MAGRFQEQQLRRAEAKRVAYRFGVARQRLVETGGERGVDLAQAPEHGGDQAAGEGAVARPQRAERGIVLDRLVERPPPPPNGVPQTPGRGAGRKSGGGGHGRDRTA